MKLKRLEHGIHQVEELAHYNGGVQLARIGNEWFALVYQSESPDRLSNSGLRAVWARVQGLKPADVEAWVRKERSAQQKQMAADVLHDAVSLLETKGYTITKGSAR